MPPEKSRPENLVRERILMSKKKTVRDVDFRGKRALVRVDFNVPIKEGKVADDTRIVASLPTLRYILEQGGALILLSHLGRPKAGPAPEFSLRPVAQRLSELLGQPVMFVETCIGEAAQAAARALRPGEVLLLENTRFYPEETKNDPQFAAGLAALGDVFVNGAVGSAPRAHASTEGG